MYLTLRHTMARIPSFAPDSHDSAELAVARGEREEMSEARAKVRQNPLDTIEESKQERAFLTPLELRGLEFVGPTPDRPVEELYMVGSFNPDAETWARAFRTIAHSQSRSRSPVPLQGQIQSKDKVDAATLEMLRRYLPLARASYGLNRRAWKACTKYRWYHWGYQSKDPAYFEEKNFEMLVEMMGVDASDVLHASYDLGTNLKPYLVVRYDDNENDKYNDAGDPSSVVVSIRGTVGTVDLITDLLSQPIDDGDGVYYHVGMLSSARAIVADMKDKGVWDDLLSRCTASGSTSKSTSTSRVVLTGHSLGAGLAYLVAVELLKCGADPSRLACIAFNPPGGLSSETSSRLETHYSVIVNKDAISRMSITTMKRLVDDVMFSLARCR